MAPRKKHQCSVIVFDINSDETFKEEATKAYLNICGQRYFDDNLDCSQLILINTAETSNKNNDGNGERYKNIVEATEMVAYDPKNVKHIEEASAAPGNWIEGIELAVELLLESSEDTRFDTYQLVVLSDLKTPLELEKKDVNAAIKNIRKNLNEIDGYIYFLGPEVPVTKMLRSKCDVYDWAQNLDVKDANSNVQIAAQILEEALGVMCDLSMGLDLVASYKYSKRGFPFAEPLRFGEVEICTACIKYLDVKSMLSLKRDKDGMIEKVHVLAEDQSVEVDYANITRGLALHDRLVIIPKDVSIGIKDYNRFFKLLGFTDMSNIPEDYMLASSTSIVTVYETKDPETGVVNYLIKACEKMKKYAVALRAYMKNTRPKLYCLIPKLHPLCFVAVELPYAEDFHVTYTTKDCESIKFNPETYTDYDDVGKLKDDIYAYLDSVNIEGKVKVHPYLRENFNKRKMVDNLLRKANGEELQKIPLPMGDLRVEVPDELYGPINAKWFSKNQKT